MVSQGREFSCEKVLQRITIPVETVRRESAGRWMSSLDDVSSSSSSGGGGGGCGGGGGGGGSGDVAIFHTNVTALFFNSFPVERALFLVPRGCFARFRLIMTVSTHRSLNLPVLSVPPPGTVAHVRENASTPGAWPGRATILSARMSRSSRLRVCMPACHFLTEHSREMTAITRLAGTRTMRGETRIRHNGTARGSRVNTSARVGERPGSVRC